MCEELTWTQSRSSIWLQNENFFLGFRKMSIPFSVFVKHSRQSSSGLSIVEEYCGCDVGGDYPFPGIFKELEVFLILQNDLFTLLTTHYSDCCVFCCCTRSTADHEHNLTKINHYFVYVDFFNYPPLSTIGCSYITLCSDKDNHQTPLHNVKSAPNPIWAHPNGDNCADRKCL